MNIGKVFFIPVRYLRSLPKNTTAYPVSRSYPVAKIVKPATSSSDGECNYGETFWDEDIPTMAELRKANLEKKAKKEKKANLDLNKANLDEKKAATYHSTKPGEHRNNDLKKDDKKGDDKRKPLTGVQKSKKKMNREIAKEMTSNKACWQGRLDEIALNLYDSSDHDRMLAKPNEEFWSRNNAPKNSIIRKFHSQELLDFHLLMEFSIKHSDEGAISADNQFARLTDVVLPLRSVPYEEQLKLKQQHMANILMKMQDRFNHFRGEKSSQDGAFISRSPMPCELAGIRFSTVTTQLRNTSEFSVNVGIDGNPNTVGFYVGRPCQSVVCVPPDYLVNLKDSHKLVAKHFQNFIRSTNYTACLHYADGGVWKNILVRSTDDGQLMIVAIINPRELRPEQIAEIEEQFKNYFTTGPAKECGVTSILFQSSLKTKSTSEEAPFTLLHGEPYISETINGQTFVIKPDSFFQTNSRGCAILFNAVKELVGENRHATVLDACCGTGAMGIQVASNVRSVVGIDPIASSIEDAKTNAEINRLGNCSFHQGTIEELLPTLVEEFTNLSEVIAILNPPKNGLSPKAINLIRTCPTIRKIIYVSCRPAFAYNNFELICNQMPPRMTKGRIPPPFRPTFAIPVDMFPYTPYVELVIMFERQDSTFMSC